jgi:hypothetical protein
LALLKPKLSPAIVVSTLEVLDIVGTKWATKVGG